MRTFLWLWWGQLVSLLGTTMTAFALPVWLYGESGRVQELALLNLAFLLPSIAVSPLTGVLVDRHNRKRLLMLSDLGAALATLLVYTLATQGVLESWHLYLTTALKGVAQSFQWPAFSALTTLLLPKAQYGRAAGLNWLSQSGAEIVAPLVAGVVLGTLGLQWILLADLATFAVAVATLALVQTPEPPPADPTLREDWGAALLSGLHFLRRWPGLLGLQGVFTLCNFFTSLAFTGLAAMVLARTDQELAIWSWVSAAGGVGGLVGSALMSIWGGPRRQLHGVLLGWSVAGSCGLLPLGLGRDWPAWSIGIFCFMAAVPLLNGSNQAIWQTKTPPALQGRVFALRRMLAWTALPLAKLAAIPLIDHWLGPQLQTGGSLAPALGWLVGVGPGAGTALLFVFSGLAVTGLSLGAYAIPLIRQVEQNVPDHTMAQATGS